MEPGFWIVEYLSAGLFTGAFGGLLGLGGAIILIPIMTLVFGLPFHVAITVALINNVAVSLSAVLRYNRSGLMHKNVVLAMNAGSIPGIVIGVAIASQSPENAIKIFYGLFLLSMIALSVWGRGSQSSDPVKEPETFDRPGHTMLGFFMGTLGGLLGIGGGGLAVTAQVHFFKTHIKNAIANSSGTIVVASAFGAIVYLLLGTFDASSEALITAALIVPGSVIGARLGAGITERLPAKHIKYIFNFTLLYIAYNMIKSGMGW